MSLFSVPMMPSIPEILREESDSDSSHSRGSSSSSFGSTEDGHESPEPIPSSSSQDQYVFPSGDLIKLESLQDIDSEEEDVLGAASKRSSLQPALSTSSNQEHSGPDISVATPDSDISYARYDYSGQSISYLLPRDMVLDRDSLVTVMEGDAVIVLAEISDYLSVVRVCKTDSVGIIPSGYLECASERIARINMDLNAQVSSPVIEFPSPTSSSDSSLPKTPCTSSDEESPVLGFALLEPASPPSHSRNMKCVAFCPERPKTVFRYPSEAYIHDECAAEEVDSFMELALWPGWLEDDENCALAIDIPTGPVKRSVRRGRQRSQKEVIVS